MSLLVLFSAPDEKDRLGSGGIPQGVGWLCGWMVIQLHRVDTLCYVILPIQGIKKADAQASAFKLTFKFSLGFAAWLVQEGLARRP